jgi:3-dehydroquinate synthase
MVAACRLSVRMGFLDEASEGEVVETMVALGLPVSLDEPVPADEVFEYIAHDKKARGGRLRFVLLDGIGKMVVRDDVPESAVVEALKAVSRG